MWHPFEVDQEQEESNERHSDSCVEKRREQDETQEDEEDNQIQAESIDDEVEEEDDEVGEVEVFVVVVWVKFVVPLLEEVDVVDEETWWGEQDAWVETKLQRLIHPRVEE